MKSLASITSQQTFALYRLPNEENHFLIKQKNERFQIFEPKMMKEEGFIFYPFATSVKHPAIFIKKEIFQTNGRVDFYPNHKNPIVSISKATYLQKAIRFVKATQTQYQKLILSRIKVINRKPGNLFQLFDALKMAYPSAFVYLINITGIGCWVGASPEILFSQNGVGHTMALAGTQPDLGIPLEKVVWGNKEIEEQAIVQRYFQKILNNRQIKFEQSNCHTVKAGNVLHLCTQFTFNPQGQVSELVSDLHPSPAVCGMPKESAKQYILEQEPHERAYYCGFLGTVNINKCTDLFVNLRCMQVLEDRFALYVGGGILPDSIPEKEWEETEFKAKTLSDVIESVYARAFA